MIKLKTTLAFLLISGYCAAQQDSAHTMPQIDSSAMMEKMQAAFIQKLAWENPVMRQAGITTDLFASGNIKSNLYGKDFFKGKYEAVRTNAWFNVPLMRFGKNSLSSDIGVSHQTVNLTDIKNYAPSLPLGKTVTHSTLLKPSLNFTRTDSLFHLPVIYSATASVIVEPANGLTQFSGTGMVLFTLKHNQNTTFSLGIIGMIDPSSPFPVIPFISYSHKLKPGLNFSVNPSGIELRKEFNAKNSLSLSNTIAGNLSLFKRDIVNLPIKQSYTTFEMKSGLTYEHLLTPKTVLTLNGGLSSMFTSKVLDRSHTTFIKNTQSAVPYIRLGVSFLPFWKGLEK